MILISLYFAEIRPVTFLSFSRHCEYIPKSTPPSNSCIDGLEASQFTDDRTIRQKLTPGEIPKEVGIKLRFEGSICFCKHNKCNDEGLVTYSASDSIHHQRLRWRLWPVCVGLIVIRTLIGIGST